MTLPRSTSAAIAGREVERQSFRSRFLTLSTWAGCTATDLELANALYRWQPGQTPESAVQELKRARAALASGETRKMASARDEALAQED